MNLADRLRWALKKRGGSMRGWSLAAGRSHAQVTMMLRRLDAGETPAFEGKVFEDLAKAAEIDAHWLQTGEGEPTHQEVPAEPCAHSGVSAFGDRLRRLRKQRRMTQVELAKAAGVSAGQLAHLEVGTRDNPSVGMVRALASALGVDEASLLIADNKSNDLYALIEEVGRDEDADREDVVAAQSLAVIWGLSRERCDHEHAVEMIATMRHLRRGLAQSVELKKLRLAQKEQE